MAAISSRRGGSWRMKCSVSRTDPSGRLTLKVTFPPAAITISVDPPPMSTTVSAPARARGKRVRHCPKRERCLARAVDHLDRGPQDLGGWVEKFGRVGGAAQRLGSDRRDLRLMPAGSRRELPQGGQRSRDPLGAERAPRADPPSEPGDLRPLLHQLEGTTRRQPRHQQQGGVGPDVDRRQVHARRSLRHAGGGKAARYGEAEAPEPAPSAYCSGLASNSSRQASEQK